MDEFDEHYLYQTALYNGLTDTTFADTGVINSVMAIDENKLSGRRNKWTKEAYKELEEAERRGKKNLLHFSESWAMKIMNRMKLITLHT